MVLVDISVMGARVEHHVPLIAGAYSHLTFRWEDMTLGIDCRIVRSRLERFSVGADGMTVYHSGLEFESLSPETRRRIKDLIADSSPARWRSRSSMPAACCPSTTFPACRSSASADS